MSSHSICAEIFSHFMVIEKTGGLTSGRGRRLEKIYIFQPKPIRNAVVKFSSSYAVSKQIFKFKFTPKKRCRDKDLNRTVQTYSVLYNVYIYLQPGHDAKWDALGKRENTVCILALQASALANSKGSPMPDLLVINGAGNRVFTGCQGHGWQDCIL
jgi:hypothetical protein